MIVSTSNLLHFTKRPVTLKEIVLNGESIQVLEIIQNSLTSAACTRFNLESVEIHIIHTYFKALNLNIISSETIGLIFYFLTSLDISTSVDVPVVVRLVESERQRIWLETFTYDHVKYQPQHYKFLLDGLPGCTSSVNLGFFLLNALQAVATRRLRMVFLFDIMRLRENIRLNISACDDPIKQFCQSHGFEVIAVEDTESDCPLYIACSSQNGKRCHPLRAKCVRR